MGHCSHPEDGVSQPFFEVVRDWSRIKHRLLHKYLQPFCFKLGSKYKELYFVDGFAGEGRYGNNADGSPLIGAKWAQKMKEDERSFNLKCIAVEAKSETCNKLRANMKSFVDEGFASVYCGTFDAHLPAILKEIKTAPALFLIDPFGVDSVDQKSLAPLRHRRDKTELLLRLDTQYIARMLGHEQKLGDERESVRKVAETMLAKVSLIFGTNIASWSEEFQKQWMDRLQSTRDLQKAKYRAIVDVYEHALKSAFEYVISLPVRESFSKNPEYYLTFCSRHPDALVLMADFMCREEEALYKSERAVQAPLFSESAADDWKLEQAAVHRDAGERLLQRLTPQFVEAGLLLAQVLMECGRPITTTEWRGILRRLECKGVEISKPDKNHVMRWRLRQKQSP